MKILLDIIENGINRKNFMEELKNIIENGIHITWTVQDVHDMMESRFGKYRTLTDEQAAMVLWHVERKHDANQGITWEVLEAAAEDFGYLKHKAKR